MTIYFHRSRDGRVAICEAETANEAAVIFATRHDMLVSSIRSVVDIDDALYLFFGYMPRPVAHLDHVSPSYFPRTTTLNRYKSDSQAVRLS